MDEAMGRRTVSGLLVTKAGPILVFREDSPRRKATSCCTRVGCSSKLFPNKDRKLCRTTNEAAGSQRSLGSRNANRMPLQGVNVSGKSGTTSRNAASTSGATDNRPRRRENVGRDMLVRLKERVTASRKRPSSGGNSPCPLSLNASIGGSSSSSQPISRTLHRPASRIRKDGDTGESVRRHRYGTRVVVERNNGSHDPSDRFLSCRSPRHRRRLQGGPIYLSESLDDSNEHGHYDMNGSDEDDEDYYVLTDQHRGMRMDIDDMSYEELLALGDRIGTVSTGLSDGALSECLKRSCYVPITTSSYEDADIKCIICQEEYLSGVEVAKMVCKHYYHTTCIQTWLRQKNWCPICKSVASTSP